MRYLTNLNRACWVWLKHAFFHIVVTCAAVAVLVVVLTLTGPGAADASGAKPVAHVTQRHRSEGAHHKAARGTHKRSSCAHAVHCKRSAAGQSSPARKTSSHGSSSADESGNAEAASEEEEIVEGEIEEGSSEEALSNESPSESD